MGEFKGNRFINILLKKKKNLKILTGNFYLGMKIYTSFYQLSQSEKNEIYIIL